MLTGAERLLLLIFGWFHVAGTERLHSSPMAANGCHKHAVLVMPLTSLRASLMTYLLQRLSATGYIRYTTCL